MAVYRFKVTFEDYDEISREIEIRTDQTFEDFHYTIQQSIGFDARQPASFYISNDHWVKGQEISLETRPSRNGEANITMSKAMLSEWVNDPHQKIYYVFDYASQWTFLIELVRIFVTDDVRKAYPVCVKVSGDAPKQKTVIALHKGVKEAGLEDVEELIDEEATDDASEETADDPVLFNEDETEGMGEEKLGDDSEVETEEEQLNEDEEEK